MDLVEIEHLTDLRMLRILNLKLNPVEVWCVGLRKLRRIIFRT